MSSDQPIFIGVTQAFSGQTLASNASSASVEIKEARMFTVQAVATGGSVLGTIQIKASTNGTDFSNVGTVMDLSSSASQLQNFPDAGYAYVQLVFTAAAGTGSLNAYVSSKR